MILFRTGKLSLAIDEHDLASGAITHEDLGLVCRVRTAPTWKNPSPLATAEIVLKSLRPHAPTYHTNVSQPGTERAGFYHAPDDSISIVNRDRRSPGELAEILLHELGHAAGHPLRTGRWTVGEVKDGEPIAFTGHEGEQARFEESVASMTGCIVAIQLGITCRWNLSPKHFLEHMVYLPVERLPAVIAESKRAANYILNL